jgi:hypothetical protein
MNIAEAMRAVSNEYDREAERTQTDRAFMHCPRSLVKE